MDRPSTNSQLPEAVLFVDQYPDIGGGQRSLLALVGIAKETGRPVVVLAPGGGLLQSEITDRFAGSVAFEPLPVVRMRKGSKAIGDIAAMLLFTWSILKGVWHRRLIPIRYINGPRAFLAGLIASRLLPGRWIYHIRIDHSGPEKKLITAILRFGRNSEVVFNSPFLLKSYMNAAGWGSVPANGRVIENSLYPPFDGLPFVDRFTDHSEGHLSIAVFGRICPEKGQDVMADVVEALPNVRVYFLGNCEQADRDYLNKILERGRGRITYEGFVPDPIKAVNELGIQLSVVPSRWEEAFGLVAVESMAMSCPTFVSKRGMLPEIAAKTGAKCFETPRQLIAQLAEVLEMSSDARRNIAFLQYEAAHGHYSFRRFSLEIETLLKGS